jgi:8-oxo-dGTP pyrophosphatase MutT (NUDIX family)
MSKPVTQRWTPAVSVAAIAEHDGRFLLVEEETPEGLQLNNPAGHLDPGESPLEAVIREALEETARTFVPSTFLGVYMARFVRPARNQDVTYVRLAFSGAVSEVIDGRSLDAGIVRTVWMTADEVRATSARHRSPLVLRCIEDHLAGRQLPLQAIYTHASLYKPDIKG